MIESVETLFMITLLPLKDFLNLRHYGTAHGAGQACRPQPARAVGACAQVGTWEHDVRGLRVLAYDTEPHVLFLLQCLLQRMFFSA